MSVDLPSPASPPVPLCWIMIVCDCFCKSFCEKAAVHEFVALNEFNPVDLPSSVTMYGAPDGNWTTFTVIVVPVKVVIRKPGCQRNIDDARTIELVGYF